MHGASLRQGPRSPLHHVGLRRGSVVNPTDKQVARGGTGHAEAVQVSFDPEKTSDQQLLVVFWKNVDPFDGRGQFCDRDASTARRSSSRGTIRSGKRSPPGRASSGRDRSPDPS